MLALLLAVLVPAAAAEDTLVEVFTVRNRPASDLVSVLEPIVAPDGSVAAMESRLIVKATPAAMAQVRGLVGSLDVAPTGLTPNYELWIKRREHWLRPVEGAEQFQEDRPRRAGRW